MLKEYIKRPGVSLFDFIPKQSLSFFKNRTVFEVETEIKYSGYIQNELDRIDKTKTLDSLKIPCDFDFSVIQGLSNESKERLCRVLPETLGQASRIFGIRPTDITLLGVFLKKNI